MNKYLILAAIGCAIGGYFFGVDVTDTKWIAKTQSAINEAVADARAEEKIKQDKANEAVQAQLDNITTVNNKLNIDLNKLRNRPSRKDMPNNTGVNCKGANGLELAREYAGFLTKYSAKAAEQDAKLEACYAYADSIR